MHLRGTQIKNVRSRLIDVLLFHCRLINNTGFTSPKSKVAPARLPCKVLHNPAACSSWALVVLTDSGALLLLHFLFFLLLLSFVAPYLPPSHPRPCHSWFTPGVSERTATCTSSPSVRGKVGPTHRLNSYYTENSLREIFCSIQ